MRKLTFAALLATTFLTSGCMERQEATKGYADGPGFSEAQEWPLFAEVEWAEKRGFDDFDGDGTPDMVEVNDTALWTQDYKIRAFKGKFENGRLDFLSNPIVVDLPINMGWFSSATKMDTADVNGDGRADVIFTEYDLGTTEDSLYYAFAINDPKIGFSGSYASESFSNGTSLLEAVVLAFLAAHDSSASEESLYDYLKMDWGDMDGNGSDDLVLMWDGRHDLSVEVVYTEPTTDGSVRFSGSQNYTIPNFMWSRSIRYVDVEDYDGDGKQDVVVFKETGSTLTASVALNRGDRFMPYKDVTMKLPSGLDLLASATKTDTYDATGDGKADFVIMAERDDQPVRIVFPSVMKAPEGAANAAK